MDSAVDMLNAVSEDLKASFKRGPMTLGLVKYPDTRLSEKSRHWVKDVKDNEELQTFLMDFVHTLKNTGGIGLSAVQVGVPYRIVVTNPINPVIMINPEIVSGGTSILFQKEGCLSVPGAEECVARDNCVKVKFLDDKGEYQEREFKDIWARVIQHELDHLDGVLFIDRLSKYKREAAMKGIKNFNRKA